MGTACSAIIKKKVESFQKKKWTIGLINYANFAEHLATLYFVY